MDDLTIRGFGQVLDHIAYKNRQSLADWEQRLWQYRSCGELVDPRDEEGRRRFRSHEQRIARLRGLAQELHYAR
ncbi:MAG: hypothetical protein ACR2QB_12305 [Gammaproteobacteria bacterium]